MAASGLLALGRSQCWERLDFFRLAGNCGEDFARGKVPCGTQHVINSPPHIELGILRIAGLLFHSRTP